MLLSLKLRRAFEQNEKATGQSRGGERGRDKCPCESENTFKDSLLLVETKLDMFCK